MDAEERDALLLKLLSRVDHDANRMEGMERQLAELKSLASSSSASQPQPITAATTSRLQIVSPQTANFSQRSQSATPHSPRFPSSSPQPAAAYYHYPSVRHPAELQADLEDERRTSHALRQDLANAVSEVHRLKQVNSEMEKTTEGQISLLTKQLEGARQLLQDAEKAAESSPARAAVKTLTRQLEERDMVVAALRQELAATKATDAEVFTSAISAVQGEVRELSQQNAAWETQSKCQISDLEELLQLKQSQVAQLEDALMLKKREKDVLFEESSSQKLTIQRLSDELAETRTHLSSVEQELHLVSSNCSNAKRQVETLAGELLDASRRVTAATCESDEKHEANQQLQGKLSALEVKYAASEQALKKEQDIEASLRGELSSRINKEATLLSQNSTLQAQLEVSKRERDSALETISNLQKELKASYEAVDSMRKDRVETEKRLVSLSSDSNVSLLQERLASANFAKDALSREVSALRKQMEAMELSQRSGNGGGGISALRPLSSLGSLGGSSPPPPPQRLMQEENANLRKEVHRLAREWESARDDVLRLTRQQQHQPTSSFRSI